MAQRRSRTKAWHRAHTRDPHVRDAARLGYRSRAALKLIDLDSRYGLLGKVQKVVDLGASPGSWSQVIREKAAKNAKIVAVDLLPIDPIEGVGTMVADIREDSTVASLRDDFKEAADLVVSDAAPDISGVRDRDEAGFIDLHDAVIRVCDGLSAKALLMKTFNGAALDHARDLASRRFASVAVARPPATKKHSKECYVVAKRSNHH